MSNYWSRNALIDLQKIVGLQASPARPRESQELYMKQIGAKRQPAVWFVVVWRE